MVGTYSSSTHKYLKWQPLTRRLAKIIKLLKRSEAKSRKRLAVTTYVVPLAVHRNLKLLSCLHLCIFPSRRFPQAVSDSFMCILLPDGMRFPISSRTNWRAKVFFPINFLRFLFISFRLSRRANLTIILFLTFFVSGRFSQA